MLAENIEYAFCIVICIFSSYGATNAYESLNLEPPCYHVVAQNTCRWYENGIFCHLDGSIFVLCHARESLHMSNESKSCRSVSG